MHAPTATFEIWYEPGRVVIHHNGEKWPQGVSGVAVVPVRHGLAIVEKIGAGDGLPVRGAEGVVGCDVVGSIELTAFKTVDVSLLTEKGRHRDAVGEPSLRSFSIIEELVGRKTTQGGGNVSAQFGVGTGKLEDQHGLVGHNVNRRVVGEMVSGAVAALHAGILHRCSGRVDSDVGVVLKDVNQRVVVALAVVGVLGVRG